MLNKNLIIIGLTIFLMSVITTSVLPVSAQDKVEDVLKLLVNKAGPLFPQNLPFGRESQAFNQNVTQLTKMGFDSPQNAKLFIQLDSIALNSSLHPGNLTLTTPTIERIASIYIK